MPLPNNLTTNEVKDAAGVEVEFLRIKNTDRTLEFAKSGETPSQPNRILVSHQEIGSGLTLRRRSLVRVDITHPGEVDTTKLVKTSVYVVADLPIGQLSALTVPAKALAHLNSFMASLGASTTILYDGTGSGSAALLNGSL